MTRRPGDKEPEPPGGRAAERLREFVEQRYPGKEPLPQEEPEEEDKQGEEGTGEGEARGGQGGTPERKGTPGSARRRKKRQGGGSADDEKRPD